VTSGGSGLRGAWAGDYAVWRPGFDALFDELDSTPVRVLSWGPGAHHKRWYAKREQICSHLAGNQFNSVLTPERLAKEDERFSRVLDSYEAQELQAEVADIIICLEVEDPSVTGPLGEILKWGPHPVFQDKIRLLAHKKTLSSSKGFLSQAARLFPPHLTYTYTSAQFESCVDIRSKCDQWVDAVRKQKWSRARRPAK